MMNDMNWGTGMMVAMSVISLVVVVGLIAGVVLLARTLSGQKQPSSPPGTETALSILDERFARGEIDREEYESRRRLITESARSRT